MPNKKELAQEILDDAFKMLGRRNAHPQLKLVAPGGEYPIFVANKPGALGQIFYHYAPGAMAENILANCEREINNREHFRKWPEADRTALVKSLATSVAARLMLTLPALLSDALETAANESFFCGVALMESGPAHYTGGVVDTREGIERLVSNTAEKQRKRLSAGVKRAGRTEVITPEDDRRLPKITLGRLKLAYKAAKKGKDPGEKITQREVANKWKKYGSSITPKQLHRWCEEELGLAEWGAVVKYLEGT